MKIPNNLDLKMERKRDRMLRLLGEYRNVEITAVRLKKKKKRSERMGKSKEIRQIKRFQG